MATKPGGIMDRTRNRVAIALIVFLVWVAITLFASRLFEPAQQQSLVEMVTHKVQPNFLMAIAFLIAMAVILKWRDLGLNAPTAERWVRLYWLPAVFIAGFAVAALLFGLPPSSVLLFVFINTCLVGISEELACRGFLLQGLRSGMAIWPAILLSAALFGGIHVLNGLMTGDFVSSTIQATAAAMSGVLFIALRLRTGSLYPVMAFHALWDFGLFIMAAGLGPSHASADVQTVGWRMLVPALFVLPNFLYGLYLLRNAATDFKSLETDHRSA